MEQSGLERSVSEPAKQRQPLAAPAAEQQTGTGLTPQMGEASCPTCGAGARDITGDVASSSYVYALGRIEARFPRASVEREFAQATGRAKTAGKTDREAFHAVLALRENRYLARQLCWVLSIQGLETYILQPRDSADFDLLVDAIRSGHPAPWRCLVIGVRGPIASPELCNGLMVPIIGFDQIYSFDYTYLSPLYPVREDDGKAIQTGGRELFSRVMQITDNAGATDEHRALNYLAMRYPACTRGGGRVRQGLFAERGRRAFLAPERHAQHRRCRFRFYQPQYRFH